MKNLSLALVCLMFVGLACSNFGGANNSVSTKPLTVDELSASKEKNPQEFATKYNGKKLIVVGEVLQVPFTYPGAYETLGYQTVLLTDKTGSVVNCKVTEAEGEKFKDVKKGDIATVTGTMKAGENTMDLEGCSKFTMQK